MWRLHTRFDVASLAYLTGDEPGIGGQLKERFEDFIVEEVPLYQPCGSGDHLYLWVEKRRRLTTDVARFLADHFGVSRGAVGYAGLKDKHAVTRQAFTVEHADEQRAATFDNELVRILGVDRHTNKLKRGHLRGNRFEIKLRGVDPTAVIKAKRMLDRLVTEGAPNYIGEQRFGYRGNNHLLGGYLMTGNWEAFVDELLGGSAIDENESVAQARRLYGEGRLEESIELWPTVHRTERQVLGPITRGRDARAAIRCIDHAQRHLYVSAWQSAIFNRMLHERLNSGRYGAVLEGDVGVNYRTRRAYTVERLAVEQARFDACRISPGGPMWGRKMVRAGGAIADLEQQMLTESGVTPEDLETGEYRPEGSRRPYRMLITDPDVSGGVDEHGPYVRLCFELARGCFATTVMREIMKSPTHAEAAR